MLQNSQNVTPFLPASPVPQAPRRGLTLFLLRRDEPAIGRGAAVDFSVGRIVGAEQHPLRLGQSTNRVTPPCRGRSGRGLRAKRGKLLIDLRLSQQKVPLRTYGQLGLGQRQAISS